MSSPSPPLTPPTSDSESNVDDSHSNKPRPLASLNQLQLRRALPVPTSSPHPFAGSSKADRAPPLYEKKLFTPPATPPEPIKGVSSTKTREPQREQSYPSFPTSPSLDESEQSLWDATISSAIDSAKAKIDLSGNNLTCIPPSIIDLKNLVVLPKVDRGLQIQSTALAAPRAFTRSVTAPALLPSPHIRTRRFSPSMTVHAFGPAGAMQRKHKSECEIEMYLMRNAIRALPRELFGLDCLVVLSLRQNKLTSLPPAIGQLTRLRELNVASNRLAHLPAEILNLHLTSLNLHPNPFTPPPPRLLGMKQTRNLGPLERGPPVPTLSEFNLRYILAPATSKARTPTWLEVNAAQPLENLSLPSHFQRIVRASTGHGVVSEKGTDAEDDATANVCPNPAHVRSGSLRDKVLGGGVYCTPVETMMEWVSVVAGVQVAESPQAWVPILWRGCSKGCLAFLEPEEDTAEDDSVPVFVAGVGEEGETFEFSDEE